MSNIQQILNSRKVANAPNRGVMVPILLEDDKKIYTEYNVFQRVNQLDQFYEDKKNCTQYRFYGNINETVNLKFGFNGQPIVKPDFTYFDLTDPYNWSVHLMAPLQFTTATTENKGDYEIETTFDGATKTIDFRLGLPALVIKNELINNQTRRGLLLYLGHNLKINDLVSLSNTGNTSENGTYRVVYVNGNKIYLQTVAVITPSSGQTTTGQFHIGRDEIELGITEAKYATLTGRTDVNWLAVITPSIFIKKLVNSIPCEYYMKKLYSMGQIDTVMNCGFSYNAYGQKTFLFTKDDKMSFDNVYTALTSPITDVYATFIKTVSEDLQMTSVQANFSNFITSTFDYEGIQTVSDHYENEIGLDIDYNNSISFLYHSLVEYNNETLTEVQINQVEHTFISNINDVEPNRVRFGFNPFYRIPIQKMSKNIEEWDVYFGIPAYAVYSEKYQKYRWREILEIGYFEAENNGIDFPYLNDAFYVFSHILLNIKNYSQQPISSILTGGYLISSYNDLSTQTNITSGAQTNTTGNSALDDSLFDKNKNDKPFEEYKGSIC